MFTSGSNLNENDLERIITNIKDLLKSRLLTLKQIIQQIITLSFDIVILIFSLWLSFYYDFGEPLNSYLNENFGYLYLFLLLQLLYL